jgi:S1-C subfamily serine protease
MRISALFGAVLALVTGVTGASAWEIDAMNRQIELTNVIVGGGCSGTVIDIRHRLVLTAHHCITDTLREVQKKEIDPVTGEIKTKMVQERLPLQIETWKRDKDFDVVAVQSHVAVVKGYDAATDTAIIQVVDEDWKPAMQAPLAPDDFPYKRGQTVYAVGNPGVVFDNSVTVGIISAPQRKLNFGTGFKIPLFQHSASTIGGNSGGAIYNDKGEIIGTLTGGVRGADIALAVPISFTKALLKRIGFGDVATTK